jgi:hypothetical protein
MSDEEVQKKSTEAAAKKAELEAKKKQIDDMKRKKSPLPASGYTPNELADVLQKLDATVNVKFIKCVGMLRLFGYVTDVNFGTVKKKIPDQHGNPVFMNKVDYTVLDISSTAIVTVSQIEPPALEVTDDYGTPYPDIDFIMKADRNVLVVLPVLSTSYGLNVISSVDKFAKRSVDDLRLLIEMEMEQNNKS